MWRSRAHLIVLVSSLVFVLLVMHYTRRISSKGGGQPASAGVVIRDNRLFDYTHGFSIESPGENWSIRLCSDTTGKGVGKPQFPFRRRLVAVARFERFDSTNLVAEMLVGVDTLSAPRTARSLAEEAFQEFYQTSEKHVLKVLKPITPTGSASVEGAYFVIDSGREDEQDFNVWIVTVAVYRNSTFAIICRTSRADYDFFRTDFQRSIGSFVVLH